MKFGIEVEDHCLVGASVALGRRRAPLGNVLRASCAATLLMASCSSQERPAAAPSAPAAEGPTSEQLGTPRDTHYTADVEATRGRVRVIVREESLCDVIPVQSVIEDGKKRYIAGEPTTSRPCNQRVARNVMVALEVGGWEVIKQYVAMGMGISILSSICLTEADRGRLVTRPLERFFPARSYGVVMRKGRLPSPQARAFMDLIQPDLFLRRDYYESGHSER